METYPVAPPSRTPSLDPPRLQNHNALINLNSIPVLIIIPAMLIAILVIVFSVLLIIRSANAGKNIRSSRNSSFRKNDEEEQQKKCKISSYANHDCVHCTPDVRSCINGGNLGFSLQSKYRGGQVFTYRELEVATEGFSKGNMIGNGTFGMVYRGTMSDGIVAAIKVLDREGKQGEREFRTEVDLMSRLHSNHVIELLGYCADQHHRLLVFEFMPNGSLNHHLYPAHHHHSRPLDWRTRLRIALDCARGLEFLHEYMNPTVIHRDFNCSSILLDQHYRAKLSNFGLAKLGSDKINGQVLTRVLGTTGYVSPEYASTGKLTTKSDVYSYGVVLLELLTGKAPVDPKRPTGQHVLVSWALPRLTKIEKVMEMMDPAIQGQCSKKELIQLAAIAAMCVQTEADYRPLMTDVVQSLIPLVKTQM